MGAIFYADTYFCTINQIYYILWCCVYFCDLFFHSINSEKMLSPYPFNQNDFSFIFLQDILFSMEVWSSSLKKEILFVSYRYSPRTWHVRTLNRYSPRPVIYIDMYVTTVCVVLHISCVPYVTTVCAVPYNSLGRNSCLLVSCNTILQQKQCIKILKNHSACLIEIHHFRGWIKFIK